MHVASALGSYRKPLRVADEQEPLHRSAAAHGRRSDIRRPRGHPVRPAVRRDGRAAAPTCDDGSGGAPAVHVVLLAHLSLLLALVVGAPLSVLWNHALAVVVVNVGVAALWVAPPWVTAAVLAPAAWFRRDGGVP
jgi:hypothetical protein